MARAAVKVVSSVVGEMAVEKRATETKVVVQQGSVTEAQEEA